MLGDDRYYLELAGLTDDLHKDYQNKLEHYYGQYVESKMKEGLGRREIVAGMAAPTLVAKRWRLYATLDSQKGFKKKGTGVLIKEGIRQGLLPLHQYVLGILWVVVKTVFFPFILLLIFGATILVNPAFGTFIVSTVLLKKPEIMIGSMIVFLVFILFICVGYTKKYIDYFYEEMIDRIIANSQLGDFGKDGYPGMEEGGKKTGLSEKDRHDTPRIKWLNRKEM